MLLVVSYSLFAYLLVDDPDKKVKDALKDLAKNGGYEHSNSTGLIEF